MTFLLRNGEGAVQFTYSNERFDVAQQVALALTDHQRARTDPGIPRYGYTLANFELAELLVDALPRHEVIAFMAALKVDPA